MTINRYRMGPPEPEPGCFPEQPVWIQPRPDRIPYPRPPWEKVFPRPALWF